MVCPLWPSSLSAWIALTGLIALSAAIDLRLAPDSYAYLDTARNVADGFGVSTFHLSVDSTEIPSPSSERAPLYPLILSLFILVGLEPTAAARIVLVTCMTCIAWLLARLAQHHPGERIAVPTLALWLALAFGNSLWHHALSEPLFVLLSLGFILLLGSSLKSGQLHLFAIAGVVAGLAMLTRYIGVVCAIAGIVSIAYHLRLAPNSGRRAALKAVRNSLALLAGFALVTLPFFAYEHRSLQLFLGAADVIGSGFVNRIGLLAFNALSVLWSAIRDLRVAVVAVLLVLAVAGRAKDRIRVAPWVRTTSTNETAVSAAIWVATYAAAIIVLATFLPLDPVSTRFAGPIYPLLLPPLISLALAPRLTADEQVSHPPTLGARGLLFGFLLTSCVFYAGSNLRRASASDTGRDAVTTWIADNTASDSLVIGPKVWWIRLSTGRTVLDRGFAQEPAIAVAALDGFLTRFRGRFSAVHYLRTVPPTRPDLIKPLETAGYTLRSVFRMPAYEILEVRRPGDSAPASGVR